MHWEYKAIFTNTILHDDHHEEIKKHLTLCYFTKQISSRCCRLQQNAVTRITVDFMYTVQSSWEENVRNARNYFKLFNSHLGRKRIGRGAPCTTIKNKQKRKKTWKKRKWAHKTEIRQERLHIKNIDDSNAFSIAIRLMVSSKTGKLVKFNWNVFYSFKIWFWIRQYDPIHTKIDNFSFVF